MTPEEMLLPDDDFPRGTYASTEEALAITEYFIQYARSRWPRQERDERRGLLWVEAVQVQFKPTKELGEKRVRLAFGSDALVVEIPDPGFSEIEKETIRDQNLERFAPLVTTVQQRTTAFLWQSLSEDERARIAKGLTSDPTAAAEIKAKIYAEARARRVEGE